MHSDREIFQTLQQSLAQRRDAALATVIAKRGPAPQGEGAKLLLLGDGAIFGTIGGGCVEAEVVAEAREILRERRSRLFRFDLSGDLAKDEGMVCGGVMEIFIEFFGGEPAQRQSV